MICAPPPLQAQPALQPKVGANQIFAALVQPDRPAVVELLRGLRDTLARKPDPATLQAARTQLDTLLQAEEKREGDMPPVLVISALASRMDAAIAGLEAARHEPAAPEKPWLLPGLAMAAGILATALAACLVALAGRAKPEQDTADIRDTLNRIRRRLDDTAGGIGQALNLADTARGEASETLLEAGAAVTRITSAARDAETRLHGCVDLAEQRLNAAASLAGEFEQWLKALPERLAEALDRAQASGAAQVVEATAELSSGLEAPALTCPSPAAEVSTLAPDIVSTAPDLLAAIETCLHHLRGAGTALAQASDAHQKAA